MLHVIGLGIVQGLTEFLPISSSGHLVVVPAMLGWDEPSLTFDLVLHLGTLLAVVAVYRSDLWELTLGLVNRGAEPRRARRLLLLLVVGTAPAAAAGLVFGKSFERSFGAPIATCVQLAITALLLLGAEWIANRPRLRHREIDAPISGAIGIAQAVSILPGISRSGATIAAALGLGVERGEAARYSFLLSIPAIAGAIATKIPDITNGSFEITASVVAGFIAATASGYIAIEAFLKYLRTHSLRSFAYYLLVFAPIAALVIEVR